jgi:hypothetical protein
MPSVTLNFSAEHATRIQDAMERAGLNDLDENGDPLPITVENFKSYLINHTQRFVRQIERQAARDAVDSTIIDVDVT